MREKKVLKSEILKNNKKSDERPPIDKSKPATEGFGSDYDGTCYGIPPERYQTLEVQLALLKKIAKEYGFTNRHELLWWQIQHLLDDPIVTVAVIGALNSGKSKLINRLLLDNIVPVSNTPCTSIPVTLGYGPADMWALIRQDGSREQITERNFIEACSGNRKENHGKYLQIAVNNSWLHEYTIRFIDTPAWDSGSSHDLLSLLPIIPNVALVTVNAQDSFSMSENDVLEKIITITKVQKVIVVVTHLDTISSEERQQVVSYIANKTKLAGQKIAIFVSLESDNNFGCNLVSGSGIQSIREHLNKFTNPGFFVMREKQIQELLNVNASSIKKLLSAKKIEMEKNQSLITQQCNKEEIKIRMSGSEWEELKDSIDLMEIECKGEANKILSGVRVNITNRILHDFSRNHDPKEWLQKEFQYELKSLMEDQFSRPFLRQLENHINKDKTWVSHEITARFKWQSKSPARQSAHLSIPMEPKGGDIEDLSHEIADFNNMRFISRVAVGGITTAMIVLMIPIGAMVSAVGFGVSELLQKDQLDKKKDEIAPVIERELDKIFTHFSFNVEDTIDSLYREMKEEVDLQHDQWTRFHLEQVKQWNEKQKPDFGRITRDLTEINRIEESTRLPAQAVN